MTRASAERREVIVWRTWKREASVKAHHRHEAAARVFNRPRRAAMAESNVLCSVTQAEAIAARLLEASDERRRMAGLRRQRPVTLRRFSWEDGE